jgi:hypothetical protein
MSLTFITARDGEPHPHPDDELSWVRNPAHAFQHPPLDHVAAHLFYLQRSCGELLSAHG